MASADKEYTVKVITLGDATGANKVADSLDRVNKSAKGTKDEGTEASKALDAFGKRGAAAQDAFEGLSRVAGGGAGAIFGMAKAVRSLGEAFVANPITASIAAILALLPLIKAGLDLFVKSVEDSTAALYGNGQATAALAENLKRVEEAGKKSGEAMKAAAQDSSTEFERLNNYIDAAAARLEKLAAAEKDRALAQIDLEEAQQLAAARSDAERKAIKDVADSRRGAVNSISDVDARARAEATAIEKKQTAQDTLATGHAQIGSAEQRVEEAARKFNLLLERGRDIAKPGNLSQTETAQQILRETAVARAELAAAEKNLDDLAKQINPLLAAATRQLEDANNALNAAEKTRQAQVLRITAQGITQDTARTAGAPDLRRGIEEEEARRYLARVRNPADLTGDQEQSVLKRAVEIHSAAASQQGRQLGETMGEAVALALKEMLPQLSQAYSRTVRAQIDAAIKAEVDRIEGQLKGLRTR